MKVEKKYIHEEHDKQEKKRVENVFNNFSHMHITKIMNFLSSEGLTINAWLY